MEINKYKAYVKKSKIKKIEIKRPKSAAIYYLKAP